MRFAVVLVVALGACAEGAVGRDGGRDGGDGRSDGGGADASDSGGPTTDGATVDAGRGLGRWEARAAALSARSEVGVAVARGRMVTVGGYTDRVEVYDFARDAWAVASSFPGTADHVTATPLPGGDRLLVAGWYVANVGPRAETYSFDPDGTTWEPRAPLPHAVGAGALVALDDRTIALVGGYDVTSHADLQLYDVATDRWRAAAPMPTARDHFGAVVVGGKLWAVGGRNPLDFTLDAVDVYDPATDRWSPGPRLNAGRSGHAVAALNGRIYAFGGEGAPTPNGTFPEVEELDQGAWRLVAPMPTPRHGMQAVAHDGKIWVPLGGIIQGGGMVSVLEVYIPDP